MPITIVQAPAQQTLSSPFSNTARAQRSSYQQPELEGDPTEQTSYILTLMTDSVHQKCMDSLRATYFPAPINKIPAHITLFHALPGPKLKDEIMPAIKDIAKRTSPYRIQATGPSRMKRGIKINVADDIDHASDSKRGRNMTRIIHAELRKQWKDWLSEQDSAPVNVHYTVMNKVNDNKSVDRALKELEESFEKGEDISGGQFQLGNESDEKQGAGKTEKWEPTGQVLGLILYMYEHTGHWTNPQEFKFQGRQL